MRPVTVAILAALALVAGVAYAGVHSGWGGAIALLVLLAIGATVYSARLRRGVAAEKFFGDAGEDETRLTGLPGDAPSEMPVDRPPRQAAGARPPPGAPPR